MPRPRFRTSRKGNTGCAGLLLILLVGLCANVRFPTGSPSQATLATATTNRFAATPTRMPDRSAASVSLTTDTNALANSTAQLAASGDPITVVGWNIGLDDASVNIVADRIAAFDGVDLWGIAEVNRTDTVPALESAVEDGEAGDFQALVGPSGGGMRLIAFYDGNRFELLEWYELEDINTTGNARAPLVLHLRDNLSGEQFIFMVNHLYRSRDEERWKQAQMLNEWAEGKTLPVIAVGDYNFDWEVQGGDTAHDQGYDLMTEGGAWEWVRPGELVTTQCSGWPCRYNSVLDFVFAAGPARDWRAESEIVVEPNDFPDSLQTSDHRPVLARFWPEETEQNVVVQSTPAPLTLPTATPSVDAALQALVPLTAQSISPTANSGANLRAGPGTDYSIVSGASAGQALDVVGSNTSGDWLQLADGTWIAAFLVDNAPEGLPVAEAAILPTALPAPVVVEEAPPTATPAPVRAVAPPSNCDPSYPTLCIPIGIGDLDCGDIGARRFPVIGSDPHRFDGDNDGVGCESR